MTEPTKYLHNPAHKIGTCCDCGGEMIFNVPRMQFDGGLIHKATGNPLCSPPLPSDETPLSRADFKSAEAASVVEAMEIVNMITECARIDGFSIVHFPTDEWWTVYFTGSFKRGRTLHAALTAACAELKVRS